MATGRRHWFVCVAVMAIFGIVPSGNAEDTLWQFTEMPDGRPQAGARTNARAVRIHIDQLIDAKKNDRFSVDLPDGTVLVLTKTYEEMIAVDQYIWRGRIDGRISGDVTFSVSGDHVSGDIVTSRKGVPVIYRVRFSKGDVHIVEEVDPRKLPRESRPIKPKEGGLRAMATAATNDSVDLVVLYTKRAQEDAEDLGSSSNPRSIQAVINQAIGETRDSYRNSGVTVKLALVHTEEVEYSEKGTIEQDLDALIEKRAGDLQIEKVRTIHRIRREHKGDIVILLTRATDGGGACGVSMQMNKVSTAHCKYAFAIVPVNCATGVYSFAHEVGHIMGADHEVGGDDSPPFEFSHGHVQPSPSKQGVDPWRTIMAQDDGSCGQNGCERILYWSNPEVLYHGDPTGGPKANNARALNATAETVARFSEDVECSASE